MQAAVDPFFGDPRPAPAIQLIATILRRSNPGIGRIDVTHVPNNDLEADFGDIKALVTVDGEWETGLIFKRPSSLGHAQNSGSGAHHTGGAC